MASNAGSIPRPGLALGRYPERIAYQSSHLDDLCARIASPVNSRWGARATYQNHVVSTINRTGRNLSILTDEALSASIRDLRPQLVRAGFGSEALAIQAFAAVREMSDRTLGMRHFDCQVQGGWAIYQGKIAEMQTGEGKTLAATLPAATAALAGVPVHVITTNDYLATRDAVSMRPLYEALGLSVGVIDDKMGADARRAAYACDITYCTNKQVAFDYLRDRVARGTANSKLRLDMEHISEAPSRRNSLLLRGLCFAIVDEADSVLVDEARIPLVLSAPTGGDESMQAIYSEALDLAGVLTGGVDFQVVDKESRVTLTPRGCACLARLSELMNPIWSAARRREELVQQALSALHLYLRDRDYVVHNGKVAIVDCNTGRILADRSWERGLHQMVECKENCKPSDSKETLARMSYQSFFCRYLKLAGMSGTASEVEREIGSVYSLSVVRIPPHRIPCRIAMREQVFLHAEDAYAAVIVSVREQIAHGRPVLIGARSVLASERFAQLLAQEGLDAQVLNARQDVDEAKIIALAGRSGQITVATNMAGRGTDILLGPGVKSSGGLHVIVTERNDSARVDRQLIGRCGRQGDPGSYQLFTSLEDNVPSTNCSVLFLGWVSLCGRGRPRRLPRWLGIWAMNTAQRRQERKHELSRREVDRESRRLNDVLAFTGAPQ